MKTNNYSTELKQRIKALVMFCFFIVAFNSCSESSNTQNESLQEEMISLMNNLHDAAVEIDAEKIINMCLDSPEFLFFSDGYAIDFEQFVENEREGFKEFANHELTWDTLYVKVLSSDVVSALAPFHQKITLKDGTILQQIGEVTWIATRTDSGLKLIYGHAGHRPDSTKN